MVVHCGFDMVAFNRGSSFVTDKKCPAGHPVGTEVGELLDLCLKCPRRKKGLVMPAKKPPPRRPGKSVKRAPPPRPGKKAKEPEFGSWTEVEGGKIFHGDAIEMLKRLPAASVDLAVFDPAYESLEKHRKQGTTTRLKDSKASSNPWFQTFPNTAYDPLFVQLYRVMKKGTHIYMFCDEETRDVVLLGGKPQEGQRYNWDVPPVHNANFKFWKSIVWDKVHAGMGYHYRASYEFILMMEKVERANKHRQLNDKSIADVLHIPRLKGKQYWPTEKPAELIQILVEQSSNPGDVVLDFFAGSGVVGQVCRATGRRFLLGDLNTSEIFKRLR
jgi:site-specific DNA-methyltransferase (adenine-specific)